MEPLATVAVNQDLKEKKEREALLGCPGNQANCRPLQAGGQGVRRVSLERRERRAMPGSKGPLVSLVDPAWWARKVSRWWVRQVLLENQVRQAFLGMGDKEQLVHQDLRGLQDLQPRPQVLAQDFCLSLALLDPLGLLELQVTLHL